MKNTARLLAICVVLAAAVAAQAQAAKPTKGGGTSVTGCLSGPNSENAYVLTNGHYRKGLEVGGTDELAQHIGHRVQLTGTWAKSGAEIGEKEVNEKGEKKGAEESKENSEQSGERHLKVTSIKMLADSCTAPSTGKTKSK